MQGECVLTLYHKEYSRERITSSKRTKCHDKSSPVLKEVTF